MLAAWGCLTRGQQLCAGGHHRPTLTTRNSSGAATASDGKIIFAPHNADGVGVFDPVDNSFVLVDISSTISGDWKI